MRSPKAAKRCLPWARHVVEHATVDQGGVEEPALRTGHVDHPAGELGALGPRQAVQRVALRHYTPAALPMRARGSAAAANPPRASAVITWAWPNPESNGAATSTRWPRAASPRPTTAVRDPPLRPSAGRRWSTCRSPCDRRAAPSAARRQHRPGCRRGRTAAPRPAGGSAAGHRRPSSRTRRPARRRRVAIAGHRVCGGRRPGRSSAGWPSRRLNPRPRSWRLMPVVGSTSHDPKPDALDWIRLTAVPPASAVHRYVVSPGAGGNRPVAGVLDVDEPGALVDRRQQCGAVGPVVEHVRPVERRRRLLPRRGRAPNAASSGSSGSPSALGQPGGAEQEVALRVGPIVSSSTPNAAAPSGSTQSACDSARSASAKCPAPSVEQAIAERPAVEGVTASGGDGMQRERHTGTAHPRADGRRLPDQLVEPRPRRVVEQPERGDQQRAGREAGRGQADRRGEDRRQVEVGEALVQLHPSVHAAGDGHRADVVTQRHLGEAFGAHRRGVGTLPGVPAGVQANHLTVGRAHEGEQVAAHPAQVRGGDGDRRVRRDRRIHGVAATVEHRHRCLRGDLVGRGGDRTERSDGAGGHAWRHRCRR